MENPTSGTHTTQGLALTIISTVLAIFSRITLEEAHDAISIIAGLTAIVSAGMAIRYYHFATKKVRQ
jgi:hypothetical protein